ncbi:SCO2583/SCO2584 N-terminal domain-containing protein [Kitasatospora sp. NPDC001660]
MPTAEEPQQPPSREPEPMAPGGATPDPFEGLVLDERFIRDAAVKEPTARTRMLAAQWREEPPVDPGGRRWAPGAASDAARSRWTRPGRRRTALIAVTAFAALLAVAVGTDPAGLLNRDGLAARDPQAVPASPRPTADVALPGGGVSDGTRCGTKGFHHFEPAPASFTFAAGPQSDAPPPGPQLVLGSYGFSRTSAKDPGHFTIGLGLGPGAGDRALDLSAPLGPQGVAVEIEGPDGLVGGAHGLPLTHDDDAPSDAGGTVHVGPENGASVEVTLPVEALCPGFDGFAVQQRLAAPTDSHNTITGQPPYRLTVSISDPAIGALRRQVGSTVPGDVLATDNRIPR